MKRRDYIAPALPGDRNSRALSAGHGISVRCDGCSKWLSTIEGCTRYRGVLLHCAQCTEVRLQPSAHVKAWQALAHLRCNHDTAKHDGHVRWRAAFREKWKHLRTNRDRTLLDAHVQLRIALIRQVIEANTVLSEGHLLWTGSGTNEPRMTLPFLEEPSTRLRPLAYHALQLAPRSTSGVLPTCGDWRCLSCLAPKARTPHAATAICSIADLMAQCDVDAQCGCWHWRGQIGTDGVAVVAYIDPRTKSRVIARGRRAALNLARKAPVPKSHDAWAKVTCTSEDCVNPEHAASGTTKERWAYMRKHGLTDEIRARTAPILRAFAEANTKVSTEQARVIMQRLAAGETPKAIGADMGIPAGTVRRIRRRPRKCDTGLRLAANSSVFAYAQAAGVAA